MSIEMSFVIREYLLRTFVLIGIPVGLLFVSSTAQAMTFSLQQEGGFLVIIYAEGEITADTPTQFQDFLRVNEKLRPYVIYLNSKGGDLLAGLELGRMIRSEKLNTSLGRPDFNNDGAACDGACPLAFLGGVDRDDFAKGVAVPFGIQRVTGDPIAVDEQSLRDYITKMGASDKVFTVMTTAPPNGLLYLNHHALAELNIVTGDVTTARIAEETGQRMLKLSTKAGSRIELYCGDRGVQARLSTPDTASPIYSGIMDAIPEQYIWTVLQAPDSAPPDQVISSSSEAETRVVPGPTLTIDFAVPSKVWEHFDSAETLILLLFKDDAGTEMDGHIYLHLDDDTRVAIRGFVLACRVN